MVNTSHIVESDGTPGVLVELSGELDISELDLLRRIPDDASRSGLPQSLRLRGPGFAGGLGKPYQTAGAGELGTAERHGR